MKMNKVLQGALVVATAATAWMGVSATDAAAATSVNVAQDGTVAGTVSIDMNTQTLTFTRKSVSSCKEVLFGVGAKTTVKVGTEKKTAYKVAAWDVHDVTASATKIDLSKLSNTKDNYIEIKTDTVDTPVIIKIPAVAKTNVVTYDASTNALTFKAGAKAATATPVSSYQVRTAYGSWSEAAELDETGAAANVFADYQYQGATLYLRTPGAEEAEIAPNATPEVVYDSETLNEVTVQETTSLPGKETKLTIAKQANGPKVTVNYVNAVLTFAKGTEWRLVTSSTNSTASPEAGYKNESVNTFLGDNESGMLEVRTAKVTGKTKITQNKCASKWTRVAIEAPVTLTSLDLMKAGNTTVPVKSGKENEDGSISYGDAGVKNAVVSYINAEGEAAEAVTAAYATTKVKKVDTYTKVVLTNAGTDAYQVIVVPANADGTAGEVPAADAKGAKALKAATAKGSGTLTLSAVADGSTIYIRKAGVAASKTWVGAYEALGVVDYPKTQAAPVEEP